MNQNKMLRAAINLNQPISVTMESPSDISDDIL